MSIRVLMFSYYFLPQYSGSALQAISLAKKLREKGINIAFLTVNHNDLPEDDEVEGFKTYRIKEGKGRYGELLLWKNMWSFLKRHKMTFDILHSHGAYLRNSFIGPLSKCYGKKSLVKVSLADNDLHGIGKGKSGWLHKQFISVIDRYVSISKKITYELREHGMTEKKIREIPNGVDTERFKPLFNEEKAAMRRRYALPEDAMMLLYVGVVDVRKNVKWLIEKWCKTCMDCHGFLTVVGPVSREDNDMKLYNSLKGYEGKLKDKLFFIHHIDKVEDYYKMADVFILPSCNEGMPNVILEAMSSGIPCLVNKVSGVEDIIIDGFNGVFFDIHEEETFISGLYKLKDIYVRREMGRNARETIVNNYPLETIADRYITLYEEMLKA